MRAHFFDIDVILNNNAKVWIVDKESPNIPLIKISRADFNLIRKGIYRGQGNLIKFGGVDYWISEELYNKLKIKSKNHKADFSNLGFSMQEFMNKELIENIEYSLNLENILQLKNTDDHIYFICSKNSKRNYEVMISKIEDKLKENGLIINKYYFISETFYNRDDDAVAHKKVRLLLQHLIGLKTEGDKFTDSKIEQYNEVYFYDDEENAIELSKKANTLLMSLISNSETSTKSIIKSEIKEKEHLLFVNYFTHNRVNRFITTKVLLEYSNLIKMFESFRYK